MTGRSLVVTEPTRSDIAGILRWTREQFGPAQAAIDDDKITEALVHLRMGPDIAGSAALTMGAQGLRRLPLRPPARHGVVYRAAEGQRLIILRLLHAAMDLPQHLSRE